MQASDRKHLYDLLVAAADVYGKDLTTLAMGMYFELLEKFELAEIRRAVYAHMSDSRQGQFMPKPADMIGKITELRRDANFQRLP